MPRRKYGAPKPPKVYTPNVESVPTGPGTIAGRTFEPETPAEHQQKAARVAQQAEFFKRLAEPREGGWKAGTKQGRWEGGTEGQWQAGTEGPWEAGRAGKWQKGATGRWVDGDGGRFEGRTSDKTGPAYDGDGSRISGRSEDVNLGYSEPDEFGVGGGAGGGGGTGSPLAAATSAVRGLGLKTAQLRGESVEELVGRGARRTRKTGQKRTQ